MNTTIYNVYVIHGYTANSTSNWFPYLKDSLENENIKVHIFDMPNSQNPSFKEWLSYLNNHISHTHQKTIFIGHSLGCVTILNYLMDNDIKNVESIFLVSGFVEESPISELSEFIQRKVAYSTIIEKIQHRLVISAKDDDIVPSNYSKKLAEKIDANFILLKQGKHFIDKDGFNEFPFLVELIKESIKE